MKRKLFAVLAAFLFVSASATDALAQPPGGGKPDTAGQNIQSLANDLAALAERVAKLEGEITMADLAGTYVLTGMITGMEALIPAPTPPPQRFASIGSGVVFGTVTLSANGTSSVTTGIAGSALTQGPWTLTSFEDTDQPQNGTWSYANGILTASDDEGDIPFNVGPGGRLLVGAFTSFDSQSQSSEAVLLILTRLQ